MLLRQKHFLPREPAEQQFLLKSSRAFARGLLPRKAKVAMYAAKPVVFATHENFVRILTTAQEGRELNKWRLHERPTVWMD